MRKTVRQLDHEIAEFLTQGKPSRVHHAVQAKTSCPAPNLASSAQFLPVGNCTGLPEHFINYIRDGKYSEAVSYRWFAKRADLTEYKGWRLSKDWHVAFYKTTTPSGIPALYFVHSGIEYVFIPRDRIHDFDAQHENALAEAQEE